jgi:hypothetical protein
VNSEPKASWIGAVGRRSVIVVILIAVITPFWIYLLFFTNIPMIVMAGIALVIVLLFSTGTAWAASAIPSRDSNPNDAPD